MQSRTTTWLHLLISSDRTSADPAKLPPWPVPAIETVNDEAGITALADALSRAGHAALGVALHCTSQRPSHDPAPRHLQLEKLAIAVPATGDEPTKVHLLVPDAPERLAPLARVFGGTDAGSKPPYVVFADAHLALTVLTPLGLAPARIGCIRTAATILAAGGDARRDERSLSVAAAERLSHTLVDPPRAGELENDELLAAAASALLPLMRSYTPELRQTGTNRVYDLETHLLPAVVDMEAAGVRLDVPAFERIGASWEAERETATDEKRVSRLDKLISTYRWWSRDYVDFDGRIRYRLHPLTAESGRFSCSDPNLQQVPSEHTAPGMRSCFVPAQDCVFVIADYAQIELRVAAHLAPCDALRRVFREGRDAHRATAATITGKPEHEISSRERQLAKAVNFGFLFGMGAKRFRSYAKDSFGLELDERQASDARAAFLQTFPGIAAWHRRVGSLSRRGAHEDVTVTTVMGRRKRFVAGRFSYNAALNIPVQGTAAEGFKLAMTRLMPALAELGGRGVLCVHDEYLAEVPVSRAEEGRALVETIMREAMATLVDSIPIEVDAKVARSWGEK